MNRILLIEDDAGAQLLYRNRLAELGYEVVVAPTGAMGLMEARGAPFDLFVIDVELGAGIDGYEVCQRLKAIPELHLIPLVLISAQIRSQEEVHRGYEAGCQAFLLRGDLTLLEDVVRAMLRTKALQDELALQNQMLERRLQAERTRGTELESSLRDLDARAGTPREPAPGRPDGMLLVDGEGVVRLTDRSARDLLGKGLEGKHLASVAPDTRLEAYVRNARTEPHEAIRFDIPERPGRLARSLSASVIPLVPPLDRDDPRQRVVLLYDTARRKMASELLKLDEQGISRAEIGPLLEVARERYTPSALLGVSGRMRAIREEVRALAQRDGPVLIQGRSGTGKNLVARILHFSGPRIGPFLPVNCAALSPASLEQELFGAKNGSAQGGNERPGLLQLAQHGSLYLHEIAVPPALLEKLRETLENGRFSRAGGGEERIDLRLIASTSQDLGTNGERAASLANLFGEERIELPPLAQREGDVEVLTQHFLERFARGGSVLSAEAAWILNQYDWPGNVRELADAIEGACAVAAGREITVADMPLALTELHKRLVREGAIPTALPRRAAPSVAREAPETVETGPLLMVYEKKALLHALRQSGGDKLAAARLIGVGKSTFYRKLKIHGLG